MAREVQDDVESLFKLLKGFDGALKCKNITEAIINRIRDKLKGYSETQLGLCIGLLLGNDNPEGNNLLTFIPKALLKMELLPAAVETLKLLKELCENYEIFLINFVDTILSTANFCIHNSASSHNVEVAEYGNHLVTAVVQHLQNSGYNFSNLYGHIIKLQIDRNYLNRPKICSSLFKLVEATAVHCPQTIMEHRWRLLTIVNGVLTRQRIKTTSYPVIEGCFRALNGLLYICKLSELNSDMPAGLYKNLKDVIKEDDVHRKVAHRAAFVVLENHIGQFSHLLRKDYVYWHTTFRKWLNHNNSEDVTVSLKVHRKFISEMARLLTEEQSEDVNSDKQMMKHFMDFFRDIIVNDKFTLKIYDFITAIQGIGLFAPVCGKFLGKETVKQFFEQIVHRAEELFQNEDKSIFTLSEYLSTLGNIGYQLGPDLSQQHVENLQRLAVLLLYRSDSISNYADKLESAVASFTACIFTAMNAGELEKFLSVTVYLGIVKACSKEPIVEKLIQNEDGKIEKVDKYKTVTGYVPFWEALFSIHKNPKIKQGVSENVKCIIVQKIYDNFIKSVVSMINRLDVQIKRKDILEDEWEGDPSSDLEANNKGDMAIVMNLQFLCSELFPKIDIVLHRRSISKLLLEISRVSNRNPLILGYYNLLATVLNIAEQIEFFENDVFEDRMVCQQTLVLYMESLLVNIHHFHRDVQEACLRVIAASSIDLVRPHLLQLPAAFEVLFRIGRNELDLAGEGVRAVDRWMSKLSNEELRPFLKDIIPHLYPFLDNRRIKVAFPDHFIEYTHSLTTKRTRYVSKRRKLIESLRKESSANETKLSKLQESILMLLSRLDSMSLLSLLDQDYSETVISWSRTPVVKQEIRFEDLHPVIYLDIFAPRALEIALTSSDSECKDAAFEVLHAVFELFVRRTSNKVEMETSEDERMFFKKILPGMFKLGCRTSDPVAQNLFHKLMLQSCCLYASNHCKNEEFVRIFIDAIMDALTYPADISVREFGQTCLREFVIKTIEHLKGVHSRDREENIDSTRAKLKISDLAFEKIVPIIEKINGYCLHPCPFKRQGAAMGFNAIYKQLREELTTVVDKFWMDLFYHFTKSLTLSDSSPQEILDAVDHICRVFKEKPEFFNKKSSLRNKPAEFSGSLLEDAVEWLLKQCSSTRPKCREKCMELTKILASKIEGISSVQMFLETLISKNGGSQCIIVDICERNVGSNRRDRGEVRDLDIPLITVNATCGIISPLYIDKVVSWLNCISATLHCYTWMQENGLPGVADIINQRDKSRFLTAIDYFIKNISNSSAGVVIDILSGTLNPLDFVPFQEDRFNRAKYYLTLNLIKFLISLRDDVNKLTSLFDKDFLGWLSRVVTSPSMVGFTKVNTESVEMLKKSLLQFLPNFFKHAGYECRHEFVTIILNTLSKMNFQRLLTTLPELLNSQQEFTAQEECICALILLKETGLIDDKGFLEGDIESVFLGDPEKKLESVFNCVADQSGYAFEPEQVLYTFLDSLLRYAFLLDSNVETLIKCITDDTKLRYKNRPGTVEKGGHFVAVFSHRIYEQLLKYSRTSIYLLILKLDNDFQKIINYLTKIFEKAQTYNESVKEDVVNVVCENWDKFQNHSGSEASELISKKNCILDLLSCLIKLIPSQSLTDNPATRCIVSYIFTELRNHNHAGSMLDYKKSIMKLLPALIDSSSTLPDDALWNLLETFMNENFPTDSKEWKDRGSQKYLWYKSIFTSLLNALTKTGNLEVLKTVAINVAGDENHPCEDDVERALQSYKFMSTQKQLTALRKIYGLFTEKRGNEYKYGAKKRISLIKDFLQPLIQISEQSVARTFYEEIIYGTVKVVEDQSIIVASNGEKLLTDRIAALLLVGELFTKFSALDLQLVTDSIVIASQKTNEAELVHFCRRWTGKIFNSKKDVPTALKDLDLLCKQTAFNVFIEIICNTSDNSVTRKLTDGILGTGIQQVTSRVPISSFRMDFDEMPKRRKKLIGIRRKARASNRSELNSSKSSVSSLQLFNDSLYKSTLHEDIDRYNFTNTYFRDTERTNDTEVSDQMFVELEADDLNKHECMPTLCGLIKYLYENKELTPVEPGANAQPENITPFWIVSLQNALCKNKKTDNIMHSKNVRLFVVKLIQNCHDNDSNMLRPYAKSLLSEIIKCILDGCLGVNVNYVIADVIEMLTSWSSVDIPKADDMLELLKFFFANTSKQENSEHLKYHVDLMKTVIQLWKDSIISVPCDLILLNLGERCSVPQLQTSLQTIFSLLSLNIKPYDDCNFAEFCTNLKRLISHSDAWIKRNTAEILGLLFKFCTKDGNEELSSELGDLFEPLWKEMFHWVSSQNTQNLSNFITCMSGMKKHYPPVVKRFIIHLVPMVSRLSGKIQVDVLDIVYTALDMEKDESYLTESTPHYILSQLYLVFELRNVDCEAAALKVLLKLWTFLSDSQLAKVLEDTIRLFTDHSSLKCREFMYEILMCTYNHYKYHQDAGMIATSNAYDNMPIKECIRISLLHGLEDSNENCRNKIMEYWDNEERLRVDLVGRIEDTFTLLYSPDDEQNFLPSVVKLLLDICRRYPGYDKPVLDDVSGAAGQNSEVLNMSLSRMQSSSIPSFFIKTIVSHPSSASFSSIGSSLRSVTSASVQRSLIFKPTVEADALQQPATPDGRSVATTSYSTFQQYGKRSYGSQFGDDSGFKVPVKYRRLKRDKREISQSAAIKSLRDNEMIKNELTEEKLKRETQVHLTRTYRQGDFPEACITYAEIVRLLQNLAKRDNVIASQLITSLIKGILEAYSEDVQLDPSKKEKYRVARETLLTFLQTMFVKIMKETKMAVPGLISIIFEIFIQFSDRLNISPDLITEASNRSGLFSLGTLALEEMLIVKDFRGSNISIPGTSTSLPPSPTDDCNVWLYLARLYRSMGESDIVQGIFEEKLANLEVREALELEAAGKLKLAKEKYHQIILKQSDSQQMDIDVAPSTLDNQKDFIYEAYFKCAANLSKWDELNGVVRNQLDENLDNVWGDLWSKENLMPWLFKSELNFALDKAKKETFSDFMRTVNSWMVDVIKAEYIEVNMGEELSMLYLIPDPTIQVDKSRKISENNQRRFLEAWAQIPSLAHNLIMNKCLQLQRLMDIEAYLTVMKKRDTSTSLDLFAVTDLVDKWKQNCPSAHDSLAHWEARVKYRSHFCSLLRKRLNEKSEKRCVATCTRKISNAENSYHLALLSCALDQKNYYVARRILETKAKRGCEIWNLNISRANLLLANMYENENLVKKVISAWRYLDCFKGRENLELSLKLPLYKHNMELCRNLFLCFHQKQDLWTWLQNNQQRVDDYSWLVKELSLENEASVGSAVSKLYEKGLSDMEKAIQVASELSEVNAEAILAENYLILAKYCQQQPSGCDTKVSESKMIQSLLRAMSHGSREARHLFPIILTLTNLATEHSEIFNNESEEVPEWMFLGWVSQLLASLDSDIGIVLVPLVIRLAKMYPVALQLPYNISRSSYKSPQMNNTIERLDKLLSFSKPMKNFIDGLGCIALPHMILQNCLTQLIDALTDDDDDDGESPNVIEARWNELSEKSFLPIECLKGSIFDSITYWKKEIQKIMCDTSNISKKKKENKIESLKNLIGKIKGSKDKMLDPLNRSREAKEFRQQIKVLNSYCPWLSTFSTQEGEIEIPGQYTGDMRPIPEHNIRISRFSSKVSVMYSVKHPIKIGIIGHDGHERNFLVKHGEDLRQDQRIEQLLKLMNTILLQNNMSFTSGRKFSIGCYSVIPISGSLGLISWIDNTDTLRNFIRSSLTIKEQHIFSNTPQIYESWLPKRKTLLDSYHSVYQKYDRAKTVAFFQKQVLSLPQDILRRSVHRLSQSAVAYHYLRTQIGTSLSAMNICQWLLGIGDRHLENTLICMTDGQLYGIDFGHAFGTGTQFLIIPELIPFRLTPQILNLFAPFRETGLIRETMTQCLDTLRKNELLIMAAMEVFVQEPLIDWIKNSKRSAKQSLKEIGEIDTTGGDSDVWYPREKVSLAKRKLHGANPVSIMAQELEDGHGDKNYFRAALAILKGEENSIRAQKPSEGLTAREQVACLIDQATDEHILGKSYAGLNTWI